MGRKGRHEERTRWERRESNKHRSKTYLIDSIEILAKITQVDVGLDNILQSHISSFENSFQVLNDLSSPVLDLFISRNQQLQKVGLTVPSTI